MSAIEQTTPRGGEVRLTEWTSCGGCAAKWGGSSLSELTKTLGLASSELLVGLAPFDDAAVYRLSPDTALVSTTDFFPPLVDDPADFGAIAAANACSDVFAMGGRVILAVNIAAFPDELSPTIITEIFRAAEAIVAEAGGVVAGGHTIRSPEPIFGLAVQGLVHPDKVLRKSGARPGDVLALSKPLGTGIVLAGGSEAEKATAIAGMRRLNRSAAEALGGLGEHVHALTDVTGFGLLGHGFEMAERSGVSVRFAGSQLPCYPGARQLAASGVKTGGDDRNRAYLAGHVLSRGGAETEALAFDPQTSGGLLCAVDPSVLGDVLEAGFQPVGEVGAEPAGVVLEP